MMPFFFLSNFVTEMQRSDVFSRLYKQMDKVTEHLIEGCRRGDRSSQLKLYKQYAQRLYIACLRIVGNSSEAEEAMQDSFLKIFTLGPIS